MEVPENFYFYGFDNSWNSISWNFLNPLYLSSDFIFRPRIFNIFVFHWTTINLQQRIDMKEVIKRVINGEGRKRAQIFVVSLNSTPLQRFFVSVMKGKNVSKDVALMEWKGAMSTEWSLLSPFNCIVSFRKRSTTNSSFHRFCSCKLEMIVSLQLRIHITWHRNALILNRL